MRCVCKTKQGTQCRNSAEEGAKTCYIHRKCKAKSKAPRKAMPKARGKAKMAKKSTKTPSPAWVKSKAWETPIPDWMKGGEKIAVKPISPQNAEPWWLR